VLTGRIQQVDPETHRFTTERDNAKRARVNLNLPAGSTQLRAGTHDGLLLDVTGTHLGGLRFHAEGDEERVIRLEPEPGAWQAWLHPSQWRNIGDTFGWDASLAKDVPLNLTLKARMGKADMDLRGLDLSRLNVTCGMGEYVVRLPESATGYDARIQSDLGKVEVYLPAATDVNLIASHSVGEFVIYTGAGTAVQVDAKISVGDIKVSDHLDEIDRNDHMLGDTGVWETDDYDTAPHRAKVRFTGSVGSFKVE
jgi:hypothetical protein